MEKHLEKFHKDIRRVLEEIPDETIESLYTTIGLSDRIFFIGNGGSQAVCSHMTTDFFKRLNVEAHSLNSDGLITCLANDYGFDKLYSSWLERFELNPFDLVIGISSSGTSPDILHGLNFAYECGTKTSLIYGFDEKEHFYDVSIFLDSHNYGVVELSTEIILHHIVERLVEKNEQ
jgi:D-sedoheptulose 7-phosphate isomerase